MFITSQDCIIHYEIFNSESPHGLALVFIPGVMMPGWIFDRQISYFSKIHTVITIDPRSQGQSDLSTEGHYSLALAQDIHNILTTIPDKKFILVGWSIAVSQVLHYALHFSSIKLQGIVLVDGLAGIDSLVPFYQSTLQFWTDFQKNRVLRTKEFVDVIFCQPQEISFKQKLLESALKTPTNTVMTLIYNYLFQDLRPQLSSISIPVLIYTIEGPRLSYMQAMQKSLPNAEIVVVPQAGHAVFVDQPEIFNHQLKTFIERFKNLQ